MFSYTNIRCIFPHGAAVANFPGKLATVKKPNPPTHSVPHRPMNVVLTRITILSNIWSKALGTKHLLI